MLSNTSTTKYKPFCHSLPQTLRRSFGMHQKKRLLLKKGTTARIRKNDTKMATKTVINTDMVNINQETLFKKVEFPYVVPVEDLKHINPYIKSLFKCAVSRKVKKIYRELENSDKRLRNSVVSGELYNTTSQNFSTDKHPKLSKIKIRKKLF